MVVVHQNLEEQCSKKQTVIKIINNLFIKGKEQVWMSHGDHVSGLSRSFEAIASSEGAPFAIIANDNKKLYGSNFI